MSNNISVLVCDDSALMRKLIRELIEEDPALHVVATAFNGLFALKKIPVVKPDIIILDIEMPEMNGIEFLRERKRLGIDIPVIILSSLARKGARITMEALELGASDFILKPSGSISRDIDKVAGDLRRVIHIYGGRYKGVESRDFRLERLPQEGIPGWRGEAADVVKPSAIRSTLSERVGSAATRRIEPLDAAEYMRRNSLPSVVADRPEHSPVEIVAIGISTGGPNALRQLLPKLPHDFEVPVVVVQHMPEGFTAEFANSLDSMCALEVKEAAPGDVLTPGRVVIAPGNYHVEVDKMKLATLVEVTQKEPVNGHRPSADVLFASVVKAFGPAAMGVLMTGMGRDGARELGNLYNKGAFTLAQEEKSCVVYGMPRVAIESGYAEEVVSLEDMASRIVEVVRSSRGEER